MKKVVKRTLELKYRDFILTPSTNAKDRFDLYRVAKNQKTGKDFNKTIGYGYRFDEAIDQFIKEKLSENGDITTLKGYVDAYKEAVAEVKSILK